MINANGKKTCDHIGRGDQRCNRKALHQITERIGLNYIVLDYCKTHYQGKRQ